MELNVSKDEMGEAINIQNIVRRGTQCPSCLLSSDGKKEGSYMITWISDSTKEPVEMKVEDEGRLVYHKTLEM
jgi:hypothetical protein